MGVVRINFVSNDPPDYQNVEVVAISIGKKVFDSGDFVKDWYFSNKYLLQEEIYNKEAAWSNSSSVDHFIMDGAPYHSAYLHFDDNDKPFLAYDYNPKEPGIEFFVKDGEEPSWEELKEYCKS